MSKQFVGTFFVFICSIAIALIIALCDNPKSIEDNMNVENRNISEIQFEVIFPGGSQVVNIWKQNDLTYYLFLPTAFSDIKALIGNNQTLYVDNDAWAGIIHESELTFGKEYEMMLESDNGSEFANLIIMKSTNIPSLFINLEADIVELNSVWGTKYNGQMVIFDGYGSADYRNDISYIRTRGNSTFGPDKKPYEIKLNKKAELLGMQSNKEWILLANRIDPSLLKNEMVFSFARTYGVIEAPDGRYVDLYINGEYRGNYYLCQKVRNNGTLVTVSDKGYILERSVQYEGKNYFTSNRGTTFIIHTPQDPSESDYEYLTNFIDELETAVYTEDGVNPATGKYFSDYIDLDSWEHRFLIDNVFANTDSTVGSAFYHLEPEEGKLYAGPIWDYDQTIWPTGAGFIYDDQIVGKIYLSDAMIRHEEVVNGLSDKFYSIYKPYIQFKISGVLYDTAEKIYDSYVMDSYKNGAKTYYDEYYNNIKYMSFLYNERLNLVEKEYIGGNNLKRVEFRGYEGELVEIMYVEEGSTIENIPQATCWVALFTGWKRVGNDERLTIHTPIYEDAVYQSQWIDMKWLMLNGLNAAELAEEDIDITALEQMVEFLKDKDDLLLEGN